MAYTSPGLAWAAALKLTGVEYRGLLANLEADQSVTQ